MNIKLLFRLVIFLVISATCVHAQVLTGRVIDEHNKPVRDVAVHELGTTNGTYSTDAGIYILKTPDEGENGDKGNCIGL